MKARGSAIIIAMLLISAIGGIAFAIGRLLFIESVSASYYVNGSAAYYAAESGLEEGFLRYRYNRNAEVPFTNWTMDNKDAAYDPGEGVFRSDLSVGGTVDSGASYAGINKASSLANVMKQYYDLRIGYIGTNGFPWFGPPDKTGSLMGLEELDFPATADPTASYYVKQDDAIKIDLTGFDFSQKLILHTKFYGNTASPLSTNAQDCKALMEIKFVVGNADGSFDEFKSLLNGDPPSCTSTLGILTTMLYQATGHNFLTSGSVYMKAYRLQDVIDIYGHGSMPTGKKVSLFLKPLYNDAAVGLATENCSTVSALCDDTTAVVSGPSTKIESTGYFGGTTRKLEANIDRQSGTLYDLFDYVIYKATP